MRLLHVVHRYLPRYLAGTEVYTAALAGGLRERGHTLQIFTGDPEAAAPEAYTWDGIGVQAVPWGGGRAAGPAGTFLAGFRNPAAERAFRALLDTFRPDLVHVQHGLGLSPWLAAQARRWGAAVVITLHDFWWTCSNTWLFRYTGQLCPGPGIGYHCGGCALQRLGRGPNAALMAATAPVFAARTHVLRRALLAGQLLIAPSQVVADTYQRLGIPAERLRLVRHGLAPASGAVSSPAARPGRGPRFLYLGSLLRSKGPHVLLEAFAGLGARGAELRLHGDAPADPAYAAELARLAAQPGVSLGGRLTRAEVPAALQDADVLLLPSLWPETHAIVVDEAFAAGRPVVVSAGSAAAERVRDGLDGLTAPPGDVAAWQRQLRRLVDEPGLLAHLRAGVQPPATLAEHVDRIEALYMEALAGRR